MADTRKTGSGAPTGISMSDPRDKEIHEPGRRPPYPSSPKGARELYTDGGDVEDEADLKTRRDGDAFEGAHDEGLKEMSEAEYLDRKEGRLQNG